MNNYINPIDQDGNLMITSRHIAEIAGLSHTGVKVAICEASEIWKRITGYPLRHRESVDLMGRTHIHFILSRQEAKFVAMRCLRPRERSRVLSWLKTLTNNDNCDKMTRICRPAAAIQYSTI